MRSPGRARTHRCWPTWRAACRILSKSLGTGNGGRGRGRKAAKAKFDPAARTDVSPPVPRPRVPRPVALGGAGRHEGDPLAIDRRARAPLAGELPAGRGRRAPRLHQGDRGAFRRRGLVAHRLPRRRGAGTRERDRRADALPHVEPREPGARPAGDRQARHPVGHRRHQRRRRRLSEGRWATRTRRARGT